MIQKQLFGIKKKISFIVSIIVLTSCVSIKMKNIEGYFNGATYYNDSLKLGVRFFGDTKFSPISKKVFKNIVEKRIPVDYKDLLVAGETDVQPKYHVLFFYKEPKKIKLNQELDSIELILNDSITRTILYKVRKKEKCAYLLLKAIGDYKNTTLMLDGEQIVNTIRFDNSLKDELTYMKIFNTYKYENNVLFVEDKFNTAPIKKEDKSYWVKFQLLTTILSKDVSYTNYKEMVNKYEQKRKSYLKPYVDSILKAKSAPKNQGVLNFIDSVAKENKVIMLNEMHWEPKHRIVAQKMLLSLKKNGFEYLAVEALDTRKDSILNRNKYPTKSSGYYTNEPFFGHFIREALQLGYKLVGYDNMRTDNRELTQAENIKKILDKDSTAKIFLYAGVDHILEKNTNKKRMAEYFTQLTNINPLTIDQVEISYDSDEELKLIESSNFKNVDKVNTGVDYFLINNIQPSFQQVFDTSELRNLIINSSKFEAYKNKKLLVSFYYAKEYSKYKSNTIPVLNKVILGGQHYELELLKGEYFMLVKDVANNLVLSEQVKL